MKKHLSTILLMAVLILGLGILFYPALSNYWNSLHQSQIVASYSEAIVNMAAEDYDGLWADAEAFNRTILERRNPMLLPEWDRERYESLLNVSGTGVMGYIEIPKIDVTLPVYHGTSNDVLQVAVGHLDSSSLPVGGESTHCVLSGHRGLPSAKLFTDLDQIQVGDVFMLQILKETLTYEVDQIRIVKPQDVDDLAIIPGEDYCTLVTCTPYGVNSHRMLVRGHRIENLAASSSIRVTAEALKINPILVAPVAAMPMLLVLGVLLMIGTGHRKRKS